MYKWIIFGSVFMFAACGAPPEEKAIVVVTTDANTNKGNDTDETVDEDNVTSDNNVTAENNEMPDVETGGLAMLGDGAHTVDSVAYAVVSEASSLATPRDLAFHPDRPTELWVLNLDDNSTVVYDGVGTSDISATRYGGLGKDHFMARPSALAFSDNGNFATSLEEDELTQGNATPADFMGATMWTSDRAIYDGGHAGHLDMLHNSPNGAGIAWETDNRFWLFDGYHQSITMYDFHSDHGPGGADHSDGEVVRYVEGEVGYVGDVPSHLEFNQEDGLLYIADTGNNRIATMDPSVGEAGARISPNYDGGAQYGWNGGVIETLIDGAEVGLEAPSGLELHDGHIFVSDNATSRILAFDMEGKLVDYVDLSLEVPAGGLMGMAFSETGDLYFVDAASDRILMIGAATGGSTDQ